MSTGGGIEASAEIHGPAYLLPYLAPLPLKLSASAARADGAEGAASLRPARREPRRQECFENVSALSAECSAEAAALSASAHQVLISGSALSAECTRFKMGECTECFECTPTR